MLLWLGAPKMRGRWGVIKILLLAAKHKRHTLGWWQQWLAAHWEQGG